ncbi:unnamed protein product [Peniophora sp. CBMAI 1063]|nr:unnamed protein product [Peniophora sp. CBMAI 1063]
MASQIDVAGLSPEERRQLLKALLPHFTEADFQEVKETFMKRKDFLLFILHAIASSEDGEVYAEMERLLENLPSRLSRRHFDIILDQIAAASYQINSRNLEFLWRIVLQRVLEDILTAVPTRLFCVQQEHDLWYAAYALANPTSPLDLPARVKPAPESAGKPSRIPLRVGRTPAAASSSQLLPSTEAQPAPPFDAGRVHDSGITEKVPFLADVKDDARDKTLHVDRQCLRACRPDCVTLCRMFRPASAPAARRIMYKLHDHFVPIIGEVKKAPPRSEAKMGPNDELTEQGKLATEKMIAKAKQQGSFQAALYLRTEAGKRQERVRVFAVCGHYVTYTDIHRNRPHKDVPLQFLWSLLVDLKDEEEAESVTELRSGRKVRKDSGPPDRAKLKRLAHIFVEEWSPLMSLFDATLKADTATYLKEFLLENNVVPVSSVDQVVLS